MIDKIKDKWIVKKIPVPGINKDIKYLCIPHSLIDDPNKKDSRIDRLSVLKETTETITDTELILGPNINHMTNVCDITTLKSEDIDNTKESFTNALCNRDYKKGTSSIFCTRDECAGKGFAEFPLWSIYMNGHGRMSSE